MVQQQQLNTKNNSKQINSKSGDWTRRPGIDDDDERQELNEESIAELEVNIPDVQHDLHVTVGSKQRGKLEMVMIVLLQCLA